MTGLCEVCDAPICAKCWRVRGVRHCRRHAGEGKPAARERGGDATGKSEARRQMPSAHSPLPNAEKKELPATPVFAVSTALPDGVPAIQPLPGQKLLSPAAREIPPRPATPEEQVEFRIAQARAHGRPAISAVAARLAEETFLRLVENSLPSVQEVPDPLRGQSVRVRDWRKAGCRTRREIPVLPDDGAVRPWVDRCPRGESLHYDLRWRKPLGGFRARVVIEVANLTHFDRIAADGYDDQPATRAEVETQLNATSRARPKARRGM